MIQVLYTIFPVGNSTETNQCTSWFAPCQNVFSLRSDAKLVSRGSGFKNKVCAFVHLDFCRTFHHFLRGSQNWLPRDIPQRIHSKQNACLLPNGRWFRSWGMATFHHSASQAKHVLLHDWARQTPLSSKLQMQSPGYLHKMSHFFLWCLLWIILPFPITILAVLNIFSHREKLCKWLSVPSWL